MGDEPLTNAAVERMAQNANYLNSVEDAARFREQTAGDFGSTRDFRYDDRRVSLNFGTLDAAGLRETLATIWELDTAGRPSFALLEVIACRGERLAAGLFRVAFENGLVNEWIQILQLDPTLRLQRRIFQFDADDRDAAIAELDRLHAEIDD